MKSQQHKYYNHGDSVPLKSVLCGEKEALLSLNTVFHGVTEALLPILPWSTPIFTKSTFAPSVSTVNSWFFMSRMSLLPVVEDTVVAGGSSSEKFPTAGSVNREIQ